MPADEKRLKVLFLCTGNSCRSQMAEGWARALKGDVIDPYSAGTKPKGIDPDAAKTVHAGFDDPPLTMGGHSRHGGRSVHYQTA